MISAGQVNVGLTATAIDGVSNTESIITIHNNDNSDDIWLGGPSVTANGGLRLANKESDQFNLKPLEQIYAVSNKTGHILSYMKQVH